MFCLLYYLAVCRYVGRWNSTFSRFWLLCGVLCIGYGLLQERLPWQAERAALVLWTLLWTAVALSGSGCCLLAGRKKRKTWSI